MPLDFRDFGADGKPAPGKAITAKADLRWWEKSGPDCADSITHTIITIDREQSSRIAQLVKSARYYGGQPMLGLHGLNYGRYANVAPAAQERLSYNVVQTATDAVIAKLSKNKPKPWFLTQGGDYKIQRKAKKLNQFVEGIFYENDAYEIGPLAARDGAIDGDGMIHVFQKDGRVAFERCNASEFFVDEVEGFYGKPRQLHRVIYVDRGVLKAAFKGKAGPLDDANSAPIEDGKQPNVADVVRVRESWRLPSGPKKDDGKHVISIAGDILLREPWQHDFFPFARFGWCPRKNGYWSQGLAEQLASTQLELNKVLHLIQRACQLNGGFVVFLPAGSKTSKAHFNNEVGTIITYVGPEKPSYETPPVVHESLFTHGETLIRRGFEIAGISELSVSSQKPAGLNSGKALRAYEDIETDRFTTIAHAYEQFYLELAKLAISTAKDIAEENGGHYEVRVPGKRKVDFIDWNDIDLEADDYVMQCFPVSSLPNDPAGRLQTIQEYIQAGMIPPDVGMKLLEFPDLQQFETLQNAMEDRLQEIFDGIIDDGEYNPPEPNYNLRRARELCLQYMVLGEQQELEPERMEMLRTFMVQLDMLDAEAQAAMQTQAMTMQAAQGGGQPQAAPVPPQQNDLIPNAPGPQGVQ
jgi:hypothetical protein